MPRPHSISNDLHGVQPDPVAADILRKEPEQESFIKLLTAPHGMVFEYVQQCSELYAKNETVASLSYIKRQQ
jgi:AMP deaminase